MRIDILTAFPDQLKNALDLTIIRRIQSGIILRIHDLHTYTEEDDHQIDDYPYGGGGDGT